MFAFFGGKSIQAPRIISHFCQHECYVEVFGGAGHVLFAKPFSKVEVYNDINSNLVNLFRCIRDDYEKFMHKVKWTLFSRQEYNEISEKTTDKIDAALKTLMAFYFSFSGIEMSGFSISKVISNSRDWLNFEDRLEKIRRRLKSVVIENLDFRECIKKYDGDKTLFYCDPPYIGVGRGYKYLLSVDEHKELADILSKINGKALLSLFPSELIKEIYTDKKWRFYEYKIHIAAESKIGEERRLKTELLITNYPAVLQLELVNSNQA